MQAHSEHKAVIVYLIICTTKKNTCTKIIDENKNSSALPCESYLHMSCPKRIILFSACVRYTRKSSTFTSTTTSARVCVYVQLLSQIGLSRKQMRCKIAGRPCHSYAPFLRSNPATPAESPQLVNRSDGLAWPGVRKHAANNTLVFKVICAKNGTETGIISGSFTNYKYPYVRSTLRSI